MRLILGRLAEGFALVAGVVLMAIVLVTTTNAGAFIADRVAGLFGGDVSALPGYEDFVRLAISAAALMFFPYCQLKRGHVAVDLLIARAPPAVQRGVDRLWLGVTVLIAGFLCWWMVLGLAEKHDDGVVTRVLGWPEWPFYVPGIASLILWGLIALSQMSGRAPHD